MKKTVIFSLLAFVVAGSGCLKDKGFDDNEYGIDITEVKAVAFPQTSKSPVTVGITGQAADLVVDGPLLTLEADKAATADVHVKLEYDQSLVTAKGLEPLPAGTFTLSTLDATIPAGAKGLTDLKLTVANSDVLDPNVKYGVGFKISSVDQGYQIASNMSTVVIAFAIKNKYDGVYTLRLKTTGWAAYGIADGVTADYPEDFNLITVGATSISLFSNYRGDDLLPALTDALAPTAFGAATPLFIFDKDTDKLTDVQNTTPDDGRGRVMAINPAVTDSRFDPATKTIYASFILKQTGRPNLVFYDTLTYVGPR